MASLPARHPAAQINRWVLLPLGLLVLGVRPATAALLTFVDSYVDGEGGIDGLGGAASVILSPDGRDVYVASGGDSAVATFHRDTESGRLVFLLALLDGFTAEGIGGASAVVVSPDGVQVYVTGKGDSALTVFNRDVSTGLLTFFESHFDGVDDNDGIGGATAVAVSPEATDVYIAGETDSSVAAFRRDPRTGSLAFLEAHFDGAQGVEGLASVRSVAVSPDGANLYAVGRADNAVVTFSRDPDTGRLAFAEASMHGVGVPSGLRRPNAVVVSDDGRQVYVASFDDDIVVLDRDGATGRLTPAQDVNLSGGPISLALDPGGVRLYAKSFVTSTTVEMNVLTRDPGSGSLGLVDTQRDGVGGARGNPTSSVAVSPDGRHIYVASDRDNALAVFASDTSCPGECDPTPTVTLEPTPTVTAACSGDCDRDGVVTVSELVLGINIARQTAALGRCPSFDADRDERVDIAELLLGVQRGLDGCAA